MNIHAWLAAVALAGVAATSSPAWADNFYPTRPIKLVVGFPPGSSTDVAARVVAERLSESLGQQVIVENKPGASSNIAAKTVAAAAGDGYTLFVATIANAINTSFQPEVSVDLTREFTPVAMIGRVPNLLVAHPGLGVKTVEQLIQAAKSKPGTITYASSGNGTSPHLSAELFSTMAGVKMLHVPYRGSSAAVTDLLAGQVSLMFSPASTVLPHIQAGKLDALASTGPARTKVLPDLATIAELGLTGFETSVWFGIVAPAGTPADVLSRLATATGEALDTPEVQARFKAQAIDVVRAGPDQFGQMIRSEIDKWAKVVQSAGLAPK